MPNSLINYIREIESFSKSFSDSPNFDKARLYREKFEEFSSVSPLLKEDIGGKRGIIYEKVDGLARKYGFIRHHTPATVSKEDLGVIEELEKIIGHIPVSQFDATYLNPGFLGPSVGVSSCLISAILDNKNLTRRDMLKLAARWAGYGVVLGEGLITRDAFHMIDAKANARYVEKKIRELYPL